MRQANTKSVLKSVANQRGFVLIAALTVLSTVLLLGSTAYLLSSTDIKVGGNFRNSQMVLQAAIGGAEHAREALRVQNLQLTSDKLTFSDELVWARGTGPLGIVSTPITDGLALASGTMNGGSISYSAYLSNDNDANGVYSVIDANGKVMITSVVTGPDNAKAQVQTVVTRNPGPSSPAAIYSKANVSGTAIPLIISGIDDSLCAAPPLGSLYKKNPATHNFFGVPVLLGSPAAPQQGTLDVDILGYIDALKPGATVVTNDESNRNFGSPTEFVTVFSDTSAPYNDGGLTLSGGTGYGILLVKGDLIVGDGFQWNGIILVSGSVTMNTGGVTIKGQIYAGTTQSNQIILNSGVDIRYHSCNVGHALAMAPLKVVSWKHVY